MKDFRIARDAKAGLLQTAATRSLRVRQGSDRVESSSSASPKGCSGNACGIAGGAKTADFAAQRPSLATRTRDTIGKSAARSSALPSAFASQATHLTRIAGPRSPAHVDSHRRRSPVRGAHRRRLSTRIAVYPRSAEPIATRVDSHRPRSPVRGAHRRRMSTRIAVDHPSAEPIGGGCRLASPSIRGPRSRSPRVSTRIVLDPAARRRLLASQPPAWQVHEPAYNPFSF